MKQCTKKKEIDEIKRRGEVCEELKVQREQKNIKKFIKENKKINTKQE
jgi:hypothetical protein